MYCAKEDLDFQFISDPSHLNSLCSHFSINSWPCAAIQNENASLLLGASYSPKPLFNYTHCAIKQSPFSLFLHYTYPQVHIMFSEITYNQDFWTHPLKKNQPQKLPQNPTKTHVGHGPEALGKNLSTVFTDIFCAYSELMCHKTFKQSNRCQEILAVTSKVHSPSTIIFFFTVTFYR